jgi:hypothetical protein
MRAIKIDGNRNPVIKNGSFVFVTNIDVVKQNCDQAMRQQLAELNYDADKGIQYFDNVLTGNPNFQRFEAQARTQILSVNGVTGIVSFNYEFIAGVLSYNTVISTIYGKVTVADQI